MEKKWLEISETVFVDQINEKKMMLYDTDSGKWILSTDICFIEFINELYKSCNLGAIPVIDIGTVRYSKDFLKAKKNNMIKEKAYPVDIKPYVLLPILNLHKDLTKTENYTIQERIGLIARKVKLLTEVNIYLSESICCMNRSSHLIAFRNEIFRQHLTPYYRKDNSSFMTLEILEIILKKLLLSGVANVNFIMGNTYFTKINETAFIEVLNHYNFNYIVHCFADDLLTIISKIPYYKINKSLIYCAYLDKYNDCSPSILAESFLPYTKFRYIISNENDWVNAQEKKRKNIDIEELVVYINGNEDFLRKNVYIQEEDFEGLKISMEEIFRNQKINSYFFGKIDILCDGNVLVCGSETPIGNIQNRTLTDIVSTELLQNNSWRLTRDLTKCSSCQFRFVCPPISTLETKIKNPMCHLYHAE